MKFLRRACLRHGGGSAVAIALAFLACAHCLRGAPPNAAGAEFFEREIRPLLAAHCYACHGPGTQTPMAGLRVDSREGLLRGGASGPAIVPGHPERSRLIAMIRGKPLSMPPTGRLPDSRIEALVEWVRAGAPWPQAPPALQSQPGVFDLEARRRAHWAWRPVSPTEPPAVLDPTWPANAVDNFLLAKLEERGLQPAPPADRYALMRRLSFALTGLPPAPEEIEAFVRDESPQAYARLVDRLLASPHFGERWARHWMDLVRYSESHGSEGDPLVPEAWRYRDYLIRALNNDTPYDQLVREALAGDLLESPRVNAEERINESMLGTAHLRMVEHGYQPVDPREDRIKWADNQIDVFSKAFQALTISCARCHDHKFDAISQKDFYALFGVFYGARPTQRAIDDRGTLDLHRGALAKLKSRIRDGLAAEWLAATESLGSELLASDSNRVLAALGDAACDPESSLYLWPALRGKSGDEFRRAWNKHRQQWRKETAAREAFNAENFESFWDLTGDAYEQWIGHGVGRPEEPSAPGEFAVLHEGDRILEGIYPSGVYTHLLSTKHAGVMQSPRFTIDSDFTSVRMLGGGMSYARLMIENYAVPRGGIYELRRSPRSGRMEWLRWKTDFWKGFSAYVEFTTREDSTNFFLDPVDRAKKPRPERPDHGRSAIGAAAVAFHNNEETPKETISPLAYVFAQETPGSPEELSALLVRLLRQAVEAWRGGRLSEAQAAFLDDFIRKGILPRSLDRLPSVRQPVEEYRRLEAEISIPRRAPGVVDEGAADQPLLIRGDPQKPGERVPRRYLSALGGAAYANPRTVRLQLAEEIASPSNPLTARVMANRIWHYLFGRGIVATPDNFGVLGARPSHPELLDFLAERFVRSGWSIKETIRLLVSSRAYRMSSEPSAQARETDPSNKLLQHMPVRRLEAEAIRDALLAAAGRLDASLYGPPAERPRAYDGDTGADTEKTAYDDGRRRSIYLEISRNVPHPLLEVFDQPRPATTRGQRDATNVPAQSLALLNSAFVIDLAREWGRAAGPGRSPLGELPGELHVSESAGPPPFRRGARLGGGACRRSRRNVRRLRSFGPAQPRGMAGPRACVVQLQGIHLCSLGVPCNSTRATVFLRGAASAGAKCCAAPPPASACSRSPL